MQQQKTVPVQYRPIKRFPGYRAGDDGSVWSCRKVRGKKGGGCESYLSDTWHQLRPIKTSGGYYRVSLCRDGKKILCLVHRLILEAFVGPCPPGQECRHKDGDKSDNRLSEIKWGTPMENYRDRIRHNTQTRHNKGELNGSAILTTAKASEIRRKYAVGDMSYAMLGREFGVSAATIANVIRGRTWN
jgi:hypothetical protein